MEREDLLDFLLLWEAIEDDEDDAEEEEHSNQLRCLALHVLAGTLIAQQKHSEVIAINIPVLVETQRI